MIKIDVKGQICPVPLIEAKKVLKDIEKDGTVLVIVDNEIAKENLEKMAKEMGCKYSTNIVNEEHYEVEIIKGLGSDKTVEDTENKQNENILVVVSSDKMGEGNDELGEILIKGFIYALTEIEKLPSTIIFYNGGAKLSGKQSSAIEDLKKLEEMGVEILTCGTCLDYYGLKEELAVGKITNMYNIVEKMNAAHRIIRP
ncbi:sulfurtransferase-like selenium metabolism protein YedF [Clostridium sp. ZS2-4]|uniref:sulfurtransferase-like selenium metabolism protein YedF n=1 Tax=Clostridium sp. ZS2-4 TaxID=2987703 RepID=UPI00227C23D7|nr:sulfurtransferase-like selenium metabolism protein YedF [Clostridium sp. ZS2-4]MCY6353773.1 sulfurtransferase-like selenium metabolism protein YedF [Clostridium sp. ZS2-4]